MDFLLKMEMRRAQYWTGIWEWWPTKELSCLPTRAQRFAKMLKKGTMEQQQERRVRQHLSFGYQIFTLIWITTLPLVVMPRVCNFIQCFNTIFFIFSIMFFYIFFCRPLGYSYLEKHINFLTLILPVTGSFRITVNFGLYHVTVPLDRGWTIADLRVIRACRSEFEKQQVV